MAADTVMFAVMKKSRMVEPAFRTEHEAIVVCDGYRRDARDTRYQVRMVTIHERPEWLSGEESTDAVL